MGTHDMNHMQHLESIALSDCAVLSTKEGTYKGSWKRAGGRSAWFMARRNLDRLITMMAPKDFPSYVKTWENIRDTVGALRNAVHYNMNSKTPGSIEATMMILEHLLDSYQSEDIFMKIRAAPGGEDGTVLACLRDARRYFMLVEAEMVAEGVVEPESKTYEPNSDPFAVVAHEFELTVEELKQAVSEFVWKHSEASKPKPPPIPDVNSPEYLAAEREIAERIGGGDFPTKLIEPVDESEKAVLHSDRDENRQSSLVPWQVNRDYYDALKIRVGQLADVYYTRRAADVWQLAPVVGARQLPRELEHVYKFEDGYYSIKRAHVPADIDDNFPRLRREQNMKEYEQMNSDYRFMYMWDEAAGKHTIKTAYADWAMEAV